MDEATTKCNTLNDSILFRFLRFLNGVFKHFFKKNIGEKNRKNMKVTHISTTFQMARCTFHQHVALTMAAPRRWPRLPAAGLGQFGSGTQDGPARAGECGAADGQVTWLTYKVKIVIITTYYIYYICIRLYGY